METKRENNIAALTHLSALGQYIFPLGNFIIPLLIWNWKKDESQFIDSNGKQILNFQFSVLLYTLLLLLIAVPVFLFVFLDQISMAAVLNNHEWIIEKMEIGNHITIITVGILAVILLASLKFIEFVYIIYGTVQASNGNQIKYPLTIPFLK